MKTKLILIVLAFLFLISAAMAQTNCIFGYVSDFSTIPLSTKTTVTATLLAPNPRWNGNTLISQAPKTVAVDQTTGKFSFTNQLAGYYQLVLNDGSGTDNRYWVWPTTTGSVPIGSLIDNSYIQPITPPNPATNYYTVANIDALLAGITAGTPTLTNGTGLLLTSNTMSLDTNLVNGIANGAAAAARAGVVTNNASQFVTFLGGLQVSGDITEPDGGLFVTTGTFLGGTFAGNGSGLTNLPATSITGMITSNQIASINPSQIYPPVTTSVPTNTMTVYAASNAAPGSALSLALTNLPAGVVTNIPPNGTNDMSATIQAALNASMTVNLLPNSDYWVTNIWCLTGAIEGHGARIRKLHSAPNFSATNWEHLSPISMDAMLYVGIRNAYGTTNYTYGSFPVVHNLIVDGGYSKTVISSIYTSAEQVWGVGYGMFDTNHNGIIFDIASGGEVSGCSATNWDGTGFLLSSHYDQLNYNYGTLGSFHDCRADNCSAGFYTFSLSGATNYLGNYYGYGNAEYVMVHNVNSVGCSVGIDVSAANARLDGFEVTGCTVPLMIGAEWGNAKAHGVIANGTMNHNSCGFYICGSNVGETVENILEILSPSSISGANANYCLGGANFINCLLSPVIVDNSFIGVTDNMPVTFTACWLNGLSATNGLLDFKSCIINTPVVATSAAVTAVDCSSVLAFTNNTATTWTNTVFVMTNCSYLGMGNYQLGGTNTDGTFGGTASSTPSWSTNICFRQTVAENALGTATNSQLTGVLPAGTWNISVKLFFSVVSGYSGYNKATMVFTNTTYTGPVQEFFEYRGGVGIGGSPASPGSEYPNWRTAFNTFPQVSTSDFGFIFMEGNVVATNFWCPTVQFGTSSTGTNQLWVGSYMNCIRVGQ